MERRKFLKGAAIAGGAAAASTLAAAVPKDMVIVSTWPRDFPGLGTVHSALRRASPS
jgi:anaerobic selenocysteine-containing dehydrogenase